MPSGDEGERIGLDTDELPKAKDAIGYIADKRLMARLAHQERTSVRMVREPSLPTWAGTLPFHLEASDWGAGYLDVHEIDLPHYVSDSLRERAPQALLRDLYRPEMDTNIYHEWETLVKLDRAGSEALREALAAQRRDPIPFVQPVVVEVMSHARAWRKVVTDRWKTILDDSQPRKSVIVFRDPTMNW